MNNHRQPKQLQNYHKYKKFRMKLIGNDICILCGLHEPIMFHHQMNCYKEHGSRAHRICGRCWWDDFIISDTHKCPGCISDMDFPDIRLKHNYYKIQNDNNKIIFNV